MQHHSSKGFEQLGDVLLRFNQNQNMHGVTVQNQAWHPLASVPKDVIGDTPMIP